MVKLVMNDGSRASLTQMETDTQSYMTTKPLMHASMDSITGKGVNQLLPSSD